MMPLPLHQLVGLTALTLALGWLVVNWGARIPLALLGLPVVVALVNRPAWAYCLLIAAIPVTVDFGSGLTVTRFVLPLVLASVMFGAVTRRCAWPNPLGSPAERTGTLLLVALLTTALLARAGGSDIDMERMGKELNGYATRFALFFVSLALVRRQEDLHLAMRALVISGALEALVVIAQVHFRLVLPGDWRFSSINSVADTEGVFRAEGTTPHPVYLAGYLQMVMPFAALLMMTERGWMRAVSAGSLVLVLYAWTHAYSRSSLLGILAMVAVAALIWSRAGRVAVFSTAIALVLGLAAHGWNVTDFAQTLEELRHVGQQVRSDQLTPVAGSLQFRIESSAGGLALFAEHPVFGVGLGQAIHHYMAVLPAWATSPFHPAVIHNAFLEIAAEAGVVGFAALLMLWVQALRGVRIGWNDPELGPVARMLAVTLAGQFVFLLMTPMVRDMWLTVPLAIALGSIVQNRKSAAA